MDNHERAAVAHEEWATGDLPLCYDLPEDKFVFANFGQCYKIDPDTLDLFVSPKQPKTCLQDTTLQKR